MQDKIKLQVEYRKTADLIPYANNARTHSDEQVRQLASSIKEFGFNNPVAIDADGGILCGHGRSLAARKLGLEEVPVVCLSHLSSTQKKAYILADNKLALNADWDNNLLRIELQDLDDDDFDLKLTGFSDEELKDILVEDPAEDEVKEDDYDDEPSEDIKSQLGDIWSLGEHRVMCGDSTSENDIKCLMLGDVADLVFTDPPYGMKKETDGVLNDNLNYDDLLEFNQRWIPLSFKFLKTNGSWYCWGIDEPLMDIYSNILKPMQRTSQITFRNLLTWDKGSGLGQNSENTRCYATADEKCLFVMCGVQGFNTNADNYFEGWEPIRLYLLAERNKCGWDIPTMKRIAGHSVMSHDHWTSKSQWNLVTEEVYIKFQNWAVEHNVEAFKRPYADIKREYENIKYGYDDVKSSYYSSRAYFNNTHDNMNNVWHFNRTSKTERANVGGHATPKPIALCARAIKSSSRDNEIVLDLFGGSGSTLIACEQLSRKAYLMELSPKYVDVIIKRWQKLTGKEATRQDGLKFNDL